jgi:hypothetical protein
MDEFGTASGLVLGAISVAAPGLGVAITGLSSVFEALGIDVSGALNSISDAVANLFNQGNNVGPLTTAFAFLDSIYTQLMNRLTDFGASGESLTEFAWNEDIIKNLLVQAQDYDDFIRLIAEYFEISTSAAAQLFDTAQANQIKQTVWPGVYDPNTGQTANVSPELRAQIMARLTELQAADAGFSAQEILDIMIGEFGSTPLQTLGIAQMLGLPALAQGGILSGATMALMGEYAGVQNNPEVIAPLSDLNSLLVTPTIEAIQSMIGGGMSQQIIRVELDGRVISQVAVQGMPEVIRMITGDLN